MLAALGLDSLGKIPLFHGVTPEHLSKLRGVLHGKTCPAGSNIITAEQPGEAVYIILSGSAKVYVEQADGKHAILAILGPGQVLGEMSLADNLGHSATVSTLEESTLLWMDRNTFQDYLRALPLMAYNLMRILSIRLRLADEQIRSLATLDVSGRIARQILAFALEYGEPCPNGDILIPLRLTQTDLADMVGATRVRVNRILTRFKKSKYISEDHKHHFILHNRVALAEYCK